MKMKNKPKYRVVRKGDQYYPQYRWWFFWFSFYEWKWYGYESKQPVEFWYEMDAVRFVNDLDKPFNERKHKKLKEVVWTK